jgi:hypothetical protein
MQLRLLLFAVLYSIAVLYGSHSAYAGQSEESRTSLRLVGHQSKGSSNSDRNAILDDLSGDHSRYSNTKDPTRQVTVRDLVRDLVSTSRTQESKNQGLDSLALEPWMPGRGAVGVKVEVTW